MTRCLGDYSLYTCCENSKPFCDWLRQTNLKYFSDAVKALFLVKGQWFSQHPCIPFVNRWYPVFLSSYYLFEYTGAALRRCRESSPSSSLRIPSKNTSTIVSQLTARIVFGMDDRFSIFLIQDIQVMLGCGFAWLFLVRNITPRMSL